MTRAPRLAYVLPTRDRHDVLAETLRRLGSLPAHDAQVVVVDNASPQPVRLPPALPNGLSTLLLRRERNDGAAARNAGVAAADPACRWIVMLDDDSAPIDLGHLPALAAAGPDVAAVAAEIWLGDPDAADAPAPPTPAPPREAGGLPEVFIGCGAAIRREAFEAAGGYDPAFGYYAEEYDLSARLMLAGGRIAFDRRFRIVHRKVSAGRDMNLIAGRLVRNNGWVMQRYAPARPRIAELRHVIDRYGMIAEREAARQGYRRGLRELGLTLARQPRRPMTGALWARFTGLAAAREALERAWIARGFRTAAIVDEGKNAGVIRRALRELGVREVPADKANTLVIGTLSPGPMLDAIDRRSDDGRVIAPWLEASPPVPAFASARAAQPAAV